MPKSLFLSEVLPENILAINESIGIDKNRILSIRKSEKIRKLLKLTNREVDCLLYTIQGKKIKEIANLMGISENTVKNYRRVILRKIGAKNITMAVFLFTLCTQEFICHAVVIL